LIYLLLRDGSNLEIEHGFDVIHKPGCIVCIDSWGASIASFLAQDVLAYTLKEGVAGHFEDGAVQNGARRRARRNGS